MEPITREEYYLAKIAGTWQGKTPEPVTIEEYYLATMAGDYSGNTPQPVTRLQYYMAKAAGVWGGSIPAPVTRLEYYWATIAGKEGHIPDPVTRQEYLLYAISQSNNDVINTVSGSTIIITDATEGRPFRGLRVFGKSTQDGAPTPEAPVPIVSAGESGNINVEVKGGNLFDKTGYRPEMDISIPSGTTILASLEETADEFIVDIINVDGTTHVLSLNKSKDHRKYGTRTLTRASRTIRFRGITETPFLAVSNEYIPYEPYRAPQSLTLQTPNGLPGVPVSKDGNYTDSNGQQWICDEIDLERGKYVQRVAIEKKSGGWELKPSPDISGRFFQPRLTNVFQTAVKTAVCNIANFVSWGAPKNDIYAFALNEKVIYFSPPKGAEITAEELNAKLNSLSFPVVVVGELATPIERDLTPEEIAAYKALRTYGPTTVVSNDAGAGMEVAYVAER